MVSRIDRGYYMAARRYEISLRVLTVDSLLTGTSIRRTPLLNGLFELVPSFLYSLYLTLYKTDTSLRQTLN